METFRQPKHVTLKGGDRLLTEQKAPRGGEPKRGKAARFELGGNNEARYQPNTWAPRTKADRNAMPAWLVASLGEVDAASETPPWS